MKGKQIDQQLQEMQEKLRALGINKSLAHLNVSDSRLSRKDTPQNSEAESTSVSVPSSVIVESAHDVYSSPSSGEMSDWCISVFGTLFSIYESKWEHVHGSEPNTKFILFCEHLTEDEFDRLLRHCRERIQRGEYWPPSTGELQVLSKELTTEERMDSRVRVLGRTPANQIEKWLVQNKLYELKRVPEYKLDELFQRYYLEAKSLQAP